MNESAYRSSLLSVLAGHSEDAGRRIRLLMENLPPKARSVEFNVLPWQDGEGGFSIRANLDGPDLYVLNKAIDEYAEIFRVIHAQSGFVPDVPMMNGYGEDFDVCNVIVDCAAHWLRSVWQTLRDMQPSIPVTVVCVEGYGTVTPLVLHQ